MPLPQRLRDILSRVINKLMKKPKNSTIQLFHNDNPTWEKSPFEPIGTGVLLEINGYHFVITAAHVVQDYALKKSRNPYRNEDDYDDPADAYLNLNNIGFIYNLSFYPIQRVVFTNTERGITENNVDLAVLTLDIESASELKQKYEFLSLTDVLLHHDIKSESRYHIYGYPAEWTDLNANNGIIKTMPFQFATKGVPHDALSHVKLDRRFNILVSYDREKMVYTSNGEALKDFSPKGISGCGLWYYNGGTDVKLIGIMIEDKWIKEQQPLMMATKIDEAIRIIYTYIIKKD